MSHAPSPCPICGKPASDAARPFCSPRCKQLDLGRWLGEGYVIPGPPLDAPRADNDDEDRTE
ncbi:MAG: DNA gyrase inhibitor YacG [Alphaproteobacteria bacterium]|nr:DNA gyrase inhibitor YacG [Alphaproteobacteria bacterium]